MRPIKTGVCAGCRAQSYTKCEGCIYLMEGLVDQENVKVLMGPLDPREEVVLEDIAYESQQEGI